MKVLFRLNFNCGYVGQLYGIFVAEKEDIDILIEHENIEIYFGEVLGKHSDIFGNLVLNDIEFVTDDPEVIKIFETYKLETGYNPLNQMLTYNSCKSIFPDREDASVKRAIEYYKNKEKE